jgi:hypothetical protein
VLRRAENIQVFYRRDLWGLMTGRFRILLQVGQKQHLSARRVPKAEFREMEVRSQQTPVRYMTVGERSYWRFEGKWHTDNEGLDQESVQALLVTRGMRNADRVGRAKTIAAQGQLPKSSSRRSIPDDVKQLVWNRASGACQSCGSRTELQFDHVIPVAHGGGSSEANLQVLCGPCNRRKAAGLTVASANISQATREIAVPEQPSASTLPPAAWYPNPSGSGQRYWDGTAWTEHVHA